jgi:hypothetical protein
MFPGEPLFDRLGLAVRQHAGQRRRRRLELQEGRWRVRVRRLDDGARSVCDQSAQHGIGVLGVAQVAGAVEGVQARGGKVGGVADVV